MQQALAIVMTPSSRYVKESKVLFKVAGFADAQRRREAAAAGGALTWICELLNCRSQDLLNMVASRC